MNKIIAAIALSTSFLAAGLASAAAPPAKTSAEAKEATTDAKAKHQHKSHKSHKAGHTTPKKTLG
ncbi:MAG: hypothetical protein Q8M37_06285 [Nevskia sp.]|nr:hypothetical protein [Nevskia sp.]